MKNWKRILGIEQQKKGWPEKEVQKAQSESRARRAVAKEKSRVWEPNSTEM